MSVSSSAQLCAKQRRSYIHAKTQVLTHFAQKYGKIISQFLWILDVIGIKPVCRTNLPVLKVGVIELNTRRL